MSPAKEAARDVAITEAAARRVLQLRAHPDFAEANRRDPGLETSLERAQRLLGAAKSGLANAERRRSATAYSDASVLARRASRQFEDYEMSVRAAFADLESERAPPPSELQPQPATESEAASPAASAKPEETVTADPRTEAGDPPSIDLPGADAGARDRETSVPTPAEPPPPPVVAPPPAAPPRRSSPPRQLRRAADAYFAGEYERAADLLSSSTFGQKTAGAHALLLRAAARYALFLLGGETDYALRGQAIEDVNACRRADSGLEPDERYFSPRFRDFFAATR